MLNKQPNIETMNDIYFELPIILNFVFFLRSRDNKLVVKVDVKEPWKPYHPFPKLLDNTITAKILSFYGRKD